MKRNDLLRAAGLAVLLLILIYLFLRNPAQPVSRASDPAGQPSSLSRTDANGVAWTLDQLRGGQPLSTEPNAPKAGPPIVVKTAIFRMGGSSDINRRASEYYIDLILEGQAGEQYHPVVKKNGVWAPAPRLRIVNEASQVVAQGDFQYGSG
jgi:hypothetical protein